ncbi:VOC family protein [Cohnella sp. AR92]|nr:VOC family protein [Cohnella sp. AR92]
MNEMIDYVETLYIPVSDAEAAGHWYAKHFGLQQRREGSYSALVLPRGQSLMFIETNERRTLNFINKEGYEMFAVTFKVDDAQALHSKMKEHGVEVGECTNDGNCGYNFKVYDLDGNRLHLWGGFPLG